MEETKQQAKSGGVPNKGALQAHLQSFTQEAIDGLVELMRTTRNEGLRFAAQKLIIDKSIADIKAVEVTGENGGPIKINLITGADYFSAIGQIVAPSTTSTLPGSPPIQDSRMASAGPQDNNGNQPNSEVGTS